MEFASNTAPVNQYLSCPVLVFPNRPIFLPQICETKLVIFAFFVHIFFSIELYGSPPQNGPPKEWHVLRCLYISIVELAETLFETVSETFLGTGTSFFCETALRSIGLIS